jgi:hypothetical protein
MKEKESVVEIIVVIIITAILVLIIAGAVINASNRIDNGRIIRKDYYPSSDPARYVLTISGVKDGKEVEYSFDVTPFEYNSYAVGDWYPKE